MVGQTDPLLLTKSLWLRLTGVILALCLVRAPVDAQSARTYELLTPPVGSRITCRIKSVHRNSIGTLTSVTRSYAIDTPAAESLPSREITLTVNRAGRITQVEDTFSGPINAHESVWVSFFESRPPLGMRFNTKVDTAKYLAAKEAHDAIARRDSWSMLKRDIKPSEAEAALALAEWLLPQPCPPPEP